MLLARPAAWLVGLMFLLTAWPAAAEHVLCMTRDSETQKLVGSMLTAEGSCPEGQEQVGRVLEASEGVVEIQGRSLRLPEGSFFPDALEAEAGVE